MKPPLPERIAIYARYSSELQNPASIDDQIRSCRALIQRQFNIPGDAALTFSDARKTGANVHRSGLNALLKMADGKAFDLLVVEGLDRLSRNLKDIATIHERLRFVGVDIFTVHEGHISMLHIGMKGTMNALYLTDMKEKVRRAHRARAEEGRTPAGLSYGYRAVRGVVDERNRTVNGIREIDEDQAKVVRRIFQEFADGKPVKAITKGLNDDGIPSPTGRPWRPGTIKGTRARGDGILRKHLYHGVMVYNRGRPTMNPVTGRRRRIILPESEWVWAKVPDLRIIDEPLWKRVQARLARDQALPSGVGRPKQPAPPASPPPEKPLYAHPLTGLIVCGACGGLANLANDQRYVCATARFTRTCQNYRAVKTPRFVEAAFPLLDQSLADSPPIRPHVARVLADDTERQQKLAAKQSQIHGRIGRLLMAVEEGIHHEQAIKRIRKLEDENRRIGQQIKLIPPSPPDEATIRDGLAHALLRMKAEFYYPAQAHLLRRVFRVLIKRITQTPVLEKKSGSRIEIELNPDPWPGVWLLLAEAWPETPGRSG